LKGDVCLKFGTISIAAMLVIIGLMSAMPLAKAETLDVATYAVTLVTDNGIYDMGLITAPENIIPDQLPVENIGHVEFEKVISPVVVNLPSSRDAVFMATHIPTTVGAELIRDITYPNIVVVDVIRVGDDSQFHKMGPCINIDNAEATPNLIGVWVWIGYRT
jgi:hypothetical protein